MTVTIDAYWLTTIISVFLPIVVALVTAKAASSAVKAVVLILLSVLTGWLTSLQATGGSFILKDAVVGIAISFITAVASHFGFLKPLSVTGSTGFVQEVVPGGLG